ncbi:calmodulin-binding receptor-like cytoplasmic kinase 3 [Rutidosis leptorrhynchoides]|uniref:calmodulin-binding receptor-like cytoplasmic kinase 3 n=1 Tax=Rutidosis leptorrhynchoides TaxID=125765 RepID=UPI003A9952A8
MVDPTIRGTISSKCLKRFAQIAYRCLLSVPKERSSMTEVVGSLQALPEIQENSDINDSSLSVMGFTWKINKYLVYATKQNTGDTSSMKCEPSTDDDYSDIDRDLRIFTLGELKPGTMIHGSVHLTMNQLAKATQNFAPSLRIGEGGFGTVYKAQLPDGQVVAIKRAHKYEVNFDALRSEFRSEVVFGRYCHRNLVESLGYVDDGMELVIIKEYVHNGTLREHLDGVHGSFLDFSQRIEICIDIAHGLTYLHLRAGDQIIHGDVKSTHILLTERMRAKVVDFGFAKFGDEETDKTHVVTKVRRGTVGYLDPMYMRTFKVTPKSDVYSFGVLLIEIFTGRRPVKSKRSPDEKMTIRWAFRKYNDGDIMDLVDPHMKEAVDSEIITMMLALAFQCAAPNRVDRPDMRAVAEQLWVIRSDHLRQGRNG